MKYILILWILTKGTDAFVPVIPPQATVTLEQCQAAADAWLKTPLEDVDAIAIGATCYKGVDPSNPQVEAQKDPA